MRKFTPEEEAILKGQLRVSPNYRALWTEQTGGALPADGTSWLWLGETLNTLHPRSRPRLVRGALRLTLPARGPNAGSKQTPTR
jgi:hypothetical protein